MLKKKLYRDLRQNMSQFMVPDFIQIGFQKCHIEGL